MIKKANNLIESRYKFDIWETRVFVSVLGKIQREDNDFKTYKITYREMIEMWGLPKTHSYKYLREAARKLMDQTVTIDYEDNGQSREKIYHLIRHVDVSSEDRPVGSQEYILVEIEPLMKPLLLQLQRNFTAYDLRYITKLGVYSIRIYELLKQYQSIGRRKFNVENLKEMFEISDAYPLFGNFYQKVIKPAIEEINEHSDIKIVEVEKIRDGRKITDLLFIFYSKTERELASVTGTEVRQAEIIFPSEDSYEKELPVTPHEEVGAFTDNTEIEHVLAQQFGIFGTSMKQLLAEYGSKEISKKIAYVQKLAAKNKNIENKAGYLMNALKHNFVDHDEMTEARKAEKIAARFSSRQCQEKIEAINIAEKDEINTRIRSLVQEHPEIRTQAMKEVEFSEKGRARLIQLEILEPDADVFRKDKELSTMVLLSIYSAHKQQFLDIVNKYRALREVELTKIVKIAE